MSYRLCMTTPETCPFCGSTKLVTGKMRAVESPVAFKPDESSEPLFTLRLVAGFNLLPPATFCAACTTVWCEADSRDAQAYIQKYGLDSLKKRLASADSSPPPV